MQKNQSNSSQKFTYSSAEIAAIISSCRTAFLNSPDTIVSAIEYTYNPEFIYAVFSSISSIFKPSFRTAAIKSCNEFLLVNSK